MKEIKNQNKKVEETVEKDDFEEVQTEVVEEDDFKEVPGTQEEEATDTKSDDKKKKRIGKSEVIAFFAGAGATFLFVLGYAKFGIKPSTQVVERVVEKIPEVIPEAVEVATEG